MSGEFAAETIEEFAPLGVRAFVTMRAMGTFGMAGADPIGEVTARWDALEQALAPDAVRVAVGGQVHGQHIATHGAGWEGRLRVAETDGHVTIARGTALVVTVADCVPIFLAHPDGMIALLHAGWRGTAAGILEEGIRALVDYEVPLDELHVHFGPAICGKCYEVGPEVQEALGVPGAGPQLVDLRALLAQRAARAGVRFISTSSRCTRCDNDRFFSHRAGDTGRQIAVMVAPLLA